VRLALGAGVMSLRLLGQRLEMELGLILTALGRAFSTSLGAFCWIELGTECYVRSVAG